MTVEDFIEEYKNKGLRALNFEGDLMVSEGELIELLTAYARAKLEEAAEDLDALKFSSAYPHTCPECLWQCACSSQPCECCKENFTETPLD